MKTQIKKLQSEQLIKVAEILKAIAHPVRLSIIELLENDNALTVSEIKQETEIEQSLLSHHLIKMKDKGILSSYREGKNSYYKLVDSQILEIFNCMQNCSFLK